MKIKDDHILGTISLLNFLRKFKYHVNKQLSLNMWTITTDIKLMLEKVNKGILLSS